MASLPNTNMILDCLKEGESYDLDFGDTWNDTSSSKTAYHTIKYDFKPASITKSEQSRLSVSSTQDVEIEVLHSEGSSVPSTKFCGNTKAYAPKECLLIIDPQTKKIVLECLSANVRVKNVRVENRSVSQNIKSNVPRPTTTDTQTDKRPAKTANQKTSNTNKPTVNAPVKPMPVKRALSPADDRLSDEESSPDTPTHEFTAPTIVSSVQMSEMSGNSVLEQDLQLSDTDDDEL